MIARTVAGVHQGLAPSYRFLAEDRVHPFSIRRRWQRMERVTFAPGRRPGDSPLPSVALADAVLWAPSPEEQSS